MQHRFTLVMIPNASKRKAATNNTTRKVSQVRMIYYKCPIPVTVFSRGTNLEGTLLPRLHRNPSSSRKASWSCAKSDIERRFARSAGGSAEYTYLKINCSLQRRRRASFVSLASYMYTPPHSTVFRHSCYTANAD